MKMLNLEQELQENAYPGRGIIVGRSADGTKAVTAYFIMGRSENSRNRIFVLQIYMKLKIHREKRKRYCSRALNRQIMNRCGYNMIFTPMWTKC